MKVDSLKLPTVTTHSNELGASSSGTKSIIEENEDDELEIAIQLAIVNSLENIDSKKKHKDEKSDTKENEEVLVETDNEETDDEEAVDDDHKQQNENIERVKPRSAPGWENVKKPTNCPMEEKDSGEEEDDEEGDENEETDDDEDENNEDENAENKSENLNSPSWHAEVNEQDENINREEIVASAPRKMKRQSVEAKTKLQPVRRVEKIIEYEAEDPMEEDDEETDDDILISQFKVARTQPPKKRTKKEKNATTKKEVEKDNKALAKKEKGVVQKKVAKALGTRTPTEEA
ncbi:uncharacterized protein [Spinacia oleracea]|uniref:Uncharacterized protein n=1 Tax=Spinacia oleracea TaxID=3562 RepID=A0ABM3RI06_SPIOL|nr:uncharacterized protein LOC130469792 [Spinacia oleracea]